MVLQHYVLYKQLWDYMHGSSSLAVHGAIKNEVLPILPVGRRGKDRSRMVVDGLIESTL